MGEMPRSTRFDGGDGVTQWCSYAEFKHWVSIGGKSPGGDRWLPGFEHTAAKQHTQFVDENDNGFCGFPNFGVLTLVQLRRRRWS